MVEFLAFDHVQLAMPKGEEVKARAFYRDLLGMRELAKPERLAGRGGAWFRSGNVELHLGVEDQFHPAKKAHVAISVSGCVQFKEKLSAHGHVVREDDSIAGRSRFFTDDCFGNRIEFICQD